MGLQEDVQARLVKVEDIRALCSRGEITPQQLQNEVTELTTIFSAYGPSVTMLNYRNALTKMISFAIECSIVGPIIGEGLNEKIQSLYSYAGAEFDRLSKVYNIMNNFVAKTETQTISTWDPIKDHGQSEVLFLYNIFKSFEDFLQSPNFIRKVISKININYSHYLETDTTTSLNNARLLVDFLVGIGAIREEDRIRLANCISEQSERLSDELNDIVLNSMGSEGTGGSIERTSKF